MKTISTNIKMLGLVMRKAPKRFFIQLLVRVLSYSYGMFYSLIFLRYIINHLVSRSSVVEVFLFILLFCLLGLAKDTMRAWFDHVYIHQSDQRLIHEFNVMLYGHLRQIDIARYETPEFFDDLSIITGQFKDQLLELIENTTEFIAACWMLAVSSICILLVDPSIMVLAVPILIAFYFEHKRAQKNVEMKKKATPFARRADYIRQAMHDKSAAGDIRMTNIFTVLSDAFHSSVVALRKNALHYGWRVAVFRFLAEFFTSIFTHISMHVYITWRILTTDRYTIGDFATTSNAIYNISDAMDRVIECVHEMTQLAIYGDVFLKFLDEKSGLRAGTGSPRFEDVLSVKDLSFRYPGSDRLVLDRISFSIRRGETVAIVGYNGAGKSTLVKLLLHLYEQDGGRITLDGTDIREFDLAGYRALFGCNFQDGRIYALSIRENILMGAPDGDLRLAIERAGAGGAIEKASPAGVAGVLTKEFDRGGIVLSGGETQKLLSARAFVGDAPIMIFDEPTSALDPISEYEFFQSLIRVSKEKTLLFISHRLSTATLADRILYMERGRILEEGTHDELMKMNGKYADMYLKQASSYVDRRPCQQAGVSEE